MQLSFSGSASTMFQWSCSHVKNGAYTQCDNQMPTLAAKDFIAKIFSQIVSSLSELHPSV